MNFENGRSGDMGRDFSMALGNFLWSDLVR